MVHTCSYPSSPVSAHSVFIAMLSLQSLSPPPAYSHEIWRKAVPSPLCSQKSCLYYKNVVFSAHDSTLLLYQKSVGWLVYELSHLSHQEMERVLLTGNLLSSYEVKLLSRGTNRCTAPAVIPRNCSRNCSIPVCCKSMPMSDDSRSNVDAIVSTHLWESIIIIIIVA